MLGSGQSINVGDEQDKVGGSGLKMGRKGIRSGRRTGIVEGGVSPRSEDAPEEPLALV